MHLKSIESLPTISNLKKKYFEYATYCFVSCYGRRLEYIWKGTNNVSSVLHLIFLRFLSPEPYKGIEQNIISFCMNVNFPTVLFQFNSCSILCVFLLFLNSQGCTQCTWYRISYKCSFKYPYRSFLFGLCFLF